MTEFACITTLGKLIKGKSQKKAIGLLACHGEEEEEEAASKVFVSNLPRG